MPDLFFLIFRFFLVELKEKLSLSWVDSQNQKKNKNENVFWLDFLFIRLLLFRLLFFLLKKISFIFTWLKCCGFLYLVVSSGKPYSYLLISAGDDDGLYVFFFSFFFAESAPPTTTTVPTTTTKMSYRRQKSKGKATIICLLYIYNPTYYPPPKSSVYVL